MKTPKATIIIGDSRNMSLIGDESIDLIVTSPPYWHLKDYGVDGQIGHGQSLHEYLFDLYKVWIECYRVLKTGRRLCVNVGDQFARSSVYGTYKVIPIHAEVIAQCESIGFDYMGAVIWQKKTTMNTTGGANVMGSYPYPPNGMLEIDYEFVLVFKKPGTSPHPSDEAKRLSKLEKVEWKQYFSGHWQFGGARQIGHEAMFPDELPRRLIKMFSFVGETVLDPFLGSGTTVKVALELGRNGVGYEINDAYIELIRQKLGFEATLFPPSVEFINAKVNQIVRDQTSESHVPKYSPRIKDARPPKATANGKSKEFKFYKVVEILDERTLRLDDGTTVELRGIEVVKREEAIWYLTSKLVGKQVFLKFDDDSTSEGGRVSAYVFLRNRIFVNAYMIKSGLALAERKHPFRYYEKFLKLEMEHKGRIAGYEKGVDFEHSNKSLGAK